MAIRCPRIYYQIIRYSIICMAISISLLFFLAFNIQNNSFFHSNSFPIQFPKILLRTNQSLSSSNAYQIETTEFYPHLPIQIFTKNRQKFLNLKTKTKKLILISTPFFGDSTWSLKSLKNQTNSGNSR